MTTKVTMISAVAAVWCALTAAKAVLCLVRNEPYVIGWWDASIAGTGRTLGRVRTAIKLVTMLGISAFSVIALAQALEPQVILYVIGGLIAVTAGVELSAPKRKKR